MLWLPATVLAQAAKVVDVRGTSLVERAGTAPRILGAGEPLDARDTISVARDSWAILEFSDQTRVTLRPNTVFRLDSYKADAPEAMLMGLVKGGLRVVTGFFGKRNPQGVRVQTAVATIGIRGTEFDARLCEADCAQEERLHPAPLRPQTVARVVEMKGVVAAARAGEPGRVLVSGAGLYEGDGVATGPAAHAVLVFRDGARVTLEQNSRFAIKHFRFSEISPKEGGAFLTLFAGNAHVWTGQLAKISPDAFLVRSAMGIIRPHGTGFSVSGCIGSACGSVSGNVSSSGASGSASASAGGNSASTSGSAGSGGASGTTTVTAGGQTASTSGSAGSGGAGATFVTPVGTASGSVGVGSGGVTQTSSGPLGNSTTTIGPGGISSSGSAGSASVNVGSDGVSASRKVNVPGGSSVTVGGSVGAGGASASVNTPVGTASGGVTVGSGGVTQTSSGPLGNSTTTIGPGGISSSGSAGSASVNVGSGGVSASRTVNVPGGSSVTVAGTAPLPPPPGGGSPATPPPPPTAGEVVGAVKDAGQNAANTAQNTANAAAEGAKNVVDAVVQGAQEVVTFVARETQSRAPVSGSPFGNASSGRSGMPAHTAGTGQTMWVPDIAKVPSSAPGGFIPLPIPTAPGNTPQIVKDAVADAGTAVTNAANQASDAAVQQAVNALNTSTAPIVAEMTALMTQLRVNPPQTEWAAQQLAARVSQLSQMMNVALAQVANAAGPVAQSESLRGAIGLAQAESLVFLAQMAAAGAGAGAQGPALYEAMRSAFNSQADSILGSPYLLASVETVGLSRDELVAARNAGPLGGAGVTIQAEVNTYLFQQGSNAAKALFAEAQALVAGMPMPTVEQVLQIVQVLRIDNREVSIPIVTICGIILATIVKTLAEAGLDFVLQWDIARINVAILAHIVDSLAKLGIDVAKGGLDLAALVHEMGRSGAFHFLENLPPGSPPNAVIAAYILAIITDNVVQLGLAGGQDAVRLAEGIRGKHADIVADVLMRGGQGGASDATGTNTAGNEPARVSVWDGEVEFVGGIKLKSGYMLADSGGRLITQNVGNFVSAPGALRPDLVKVDPDLFRGGDKPFDGGLYVWVRDGAVQVTKDDQAVDVSAGNAAVATKDRVRLLDAVPNFMRFDPTPPPNLPLTAKLDAFRLPDGALQNMCVIR